MKYHQSAIAAAVAASATFGNAQEQFSTGEFKHLNGSQCVPFNIFPDLECPPSIMPEGAAGTVMVTLHPDMVTATPTIVGVEGPLGPTLSISYNLQGVDARCNEAHHRRNLINHDPGGNNTIMECGMALHEYNSCDEIWGRLHSICGPRRDELVTGIAPPAIGKFEELCPTNEDGTFGPPIPTAPTTWEVVKYIADSDGNTEGSFDIFVGAMDRTKLEGKPMVLYDHDGVQFACSQISFVGTVDEEAAEEVDQADDSEESEPAEDSIEDIQSASEGASTSVVIAIAHVFFGVIVPYL